MSFMLLVFIIGIPVIIAIIAAIVTVVSVAAFVAARQDEDNQFSLLNQNVVRLTDQWKRPREVQCI